MTKLFLDVLDKPQQVLWQKLKDLSKNSCVLAGGTAIAMQIGHRISEDFDLFIPGVISRATRKKALELMEGIDRIPLDDTHQLTILSKTGLKLTVVSHPHIPLYKLVKTDSLSLFDLRDLASNKAFTIGQRGKWRDYVDLYFLLKEKIITLDQLLNESKKRFKVEFDPRRFLDQLTFTQDLGDFNIEFIRDGTTPANISQFMAKQVKEYLSANE
ncbi:MAG: nucleotidyl transferase AbiEii/AbiGii toxin family protein [Patescibacteria group bacterium]